MTYFQGPNYSYKHFHSSKLYFGNSKRDPQSRTNIANQKPYNSVFYEYQWKITWNISNHNPTAYQKGNTCVPQINEIFFAEFQY